MVCDDWNPMLPDQILETGHLIRFTAKVDLPVDNTSPIKILAQRPTVRATVCGEYQYCIERGHSMPSSEF